MVDNQFWPVRTFRINRKCIITQLKISINKEIVSRNESNKFVQLILVLNATDLNRQSIVSSGFETSPMNLEQTFDECQGS